MGLTCNITLFRHGKVAFDQTRWVTSGALRAVVAGYDAAQIGGAPDGDVPPVDVVITSNLRRSVASAQVLFGRYDHSDPLFREAELPDFWALPVPLPAALWLAVARVAWRMGAARHCEGFGAFQIRAKVAADRLVDLAETGKTVGFVGHGILNIYIAEALRARGFVGPARVRRGHWSATAFRRDRA